MIFIIVIATIIIIALLFVAYIFYSNNKIKYKQDSKNKNHSNYDKEAPSPVITLLKKESLNDCNNISNLTINKDIMQIEDNLFINCTNLSNIKVEENQLDDLLNMGSSVDDKTLNSFSSLYSAVRALPMDEQSRMLDMVERGEFSISCR